MDHPSAFDLFHPPQVRTGSAERVAAVGLDARRIELGMGRESVLAGMSFDLFSQLSLRVLQRTNTMIVISVRFVLRKEHNRCVGLYCH